MISNASSKIKTCKAISKYSYAFANNITVKHIAVAVSKKIDARSKTKTYWLETATFSAYAESDAEEVVVLLRFLSPCSENALCLDAKAFCSNSACIESNAELSTKFDGGMTPVGEVGILEETGKGN